jgi:hypothetical protein
MTTLSNGAEGHPGSQRATIEVGVGFDGVPMRSPGIASQMPCHLAGLLLKNYWESGRQGASSRRVFSGEKTSHAKFLMSGANRADSMRGGVGVPPRYRCLGLWLTVPLLDAWQPVRGPDRSGAHRGPLEMQRGAWAHSQGQVKRQGGGPGW